MYWGGQQRRIPAIEGKTPGSKPRDLSMSWAFASCVLEGYERQSPGDSSKLPGYLDSSLLPEKKKNSIYTATQISFLSIPPQQRYYTAREFQQWRQDSCVQTRSCRTSNVVHAPMCRMSQRGRGQEGISVYA